MAVLIYRGNKYIQHKEPVNPKCVELSYGRSVYTTNQAKARKQVQSSLTYRGVTYKK